MRLIDLSICEIIDSERRGYATCQKGPVAKHPSAMDVLTKPKHC